MSEKNLLIMIIDTNIVRWSFYELNKQQNQNFTLNDCVDASVAFLNAFIAMNQNNSVCLIVAHNTKAEYLYPSRSKLCDRSVTPWSRCDQIRDIDEQVKENIKRLCAEDEQTDPINIIQNNNSTLTSALGLALCYANRTYKNNTNISEEIKCRVLIVKLYEENANQYMNFMNMIFTAEKLNIPIDSCVLIKDSSLLQQASILTNGIYFKIPHINGLLHYLIWLFLPNENMRKQLVLTPKVQIDYRAACFCHRQLIDTGYVCSVCLSVFCSFTPICSTCDCNFQFDINILKMGKKLDIMSKKTSSSIDPSHQTVNSSSANQTPSMMLQDHDHDDIGGQSQHSVDSQSDHLMTRTISAASASQSQTLDEESQRSACARIDEITNNDVYHNFNDSFEMLE